MHMRYAKTAVCFDRVCVMTEWYWPPIYLPGHRKWVTCLEVKKVRRMELYVGLV